MNANRLNMLILRKDKVLDYLSVLLIMQFLYLNRVNRQQIAKFILLR